MKHLDRYAELLVRTGVNIQDNQILHISIDIALAEFGRLLATKAYEAGASEVIMNWTDEKSARIRYDLASDEIFNQVDEWRVVRSNHYVDKNAGYLRIKSNDPDIMNGVDPSRISREIKAYAKPFKYYRNRLMANRNTWCVAAMPTPSWAKKVFPQLPEDEAVEALWEAIIKSTRVDMDDPVQAWADHQKNLDAKVKVLNDTQFKALKYSNSLGTDLTVELPDNHIWFGGADSHIPSGIKFIANMPTEEVFTLPKRTGVNGKVYSSYPLIYNGVQIKDMWFEFSEGKVVDYGANENLETLKELLGTDDNAMYLGEVALVPYDSPISNQGILFYDTLFDEKRRLSPGFGGSLSHMS